MEMSARSQLSPGGRTDKPLAGILSRRPNTDPPMISRLPRFLYALVWLPALPLALLRLLWRARRQPAYLANLGERLGRYRHAAPQPSVWVHAVSVGETRAAEPLVRAILTQWPDHHVVLTAMTPTGRETAQSLFGGEGRIVSVYLPYDVGLCVDGFLDHFQPTFGVIMETELWPTLLARCRARAIPVMLANARLSARSAARYARWPSLTRLTLGALATIGSQTEDDGRRLAALGAHAVVTTGNIKFDITPPAPLLALGHRFRARIGDRPVMLLASSRDGEEALVIDAFARLADPSVLLIIVPRHPQRFDTVAQLAEARGMRLRRRSDEAPIDASTRVWLGDSMGEMFAYYGCADVALIGGSWLPFGGQNLIEACAVGTPPVIGPHTWNFSQIAEQAVAAHAAARADDAADGVRIALALLKDADRRRERADACRTFAAAHTGATQRSIALIEAMLTGFPAAH